MALVLPRTIFFHNGPDRRPLRAEGDPGMRIPTYEVGGFHAWPAHTPLDATDRKKRFFCFVRHPLAWLRSFWSRQMQFGWTPNGYSSQLESDNFADFLARAISLFPDGLATMRFRPFVEQCHEVGRQERLAQDLRRILEGAGEGIDPAVLDGISPTGVEIHPQIRAAATAPRALLEKVLASEAETCSRFGYAEIPPGMIGESTVCTAQYVVLGRARRRPAWSA